MSELKEVKVPDIGGADGVPVIEILVAAGETVAAEQGLVTLESDKATMDVPSPFAGVVRELKVAEDDEVAEGDVIALIEASDEVAAAAELADAPAPASAAAEPAQATPEPETESAPESAARPAPATAAPPAAPGPTDTGKRGTPPVPFDASVVMPDKTPYASPAVRAFARELGVDISQVEGSGRKGRIQRVDVQNHVKQVMARGGRAVSAGVGSGTGLDLLPWPKVDFSKFGEVEEQSLSRIQKISARNLARNWAMIPHVTQHDEADITDMEAFRKRLGKENPDVKVTPLVFLIKAAVAALQAYPRFNSSLQADGETLVLKHYYNIGIAVDTPNGLVVPVIRDCDQKGLLELAHELAAVSVKAREGKLGQADITGGCFSISSLGGIGGTKFTPIVNAPEVAILGVSRSRMTPVWDGEAFQPRLMLPLSVSYDHRVIDGALAARFTAHLARLLGDLRRLLV